MRGFHLKARHTVEEDEDQGHQNGRVSYKFDKGLRLNLVFRKYNYLVNYFTLQK